MDSAGGYASRLEGVTRQARLEPPTTIAGALAAHGIDALDLDELDVWAYGDAEGLGA